MHSYVRIFVYFCTLKQRNKKMTRKHATYIAGSIGKSMNYNGNRAIEWE